MIEVSKQTCIIVLCPCGAGYEWSEDAGIPSSCAYCGESGDRFGLENVKDGLSKRATWVQESMFT